MNAETILVAAIVSIVAPSIQSYFVNRNRRSEKKLDWEREDEMAKHAAVTAGLLLENNKKVAATAAETNSKLDVIHTLVNSNMTAAMKSELEATIQKLSLMRQIVDRDKADKIKVLPEALAAIASVETKISELTAQLNDRLKQTAIAEARLKK